MVTRSKHTQGDVWLIQLDPTVGSEIQKTRPCLIVSPMEMNEHLKTVIVAPLTTGNKPAPFRVAVTLSDKSGLILLDQIRTVDKSRLIKKMGAVSQDVFFEVSGVLQKMFVVE